ncbi:MARVEL domain-containing protein 1-like [Ornithodoros turicata]|uniref:Putative members of chemokine-like factor super family n=1 Tax=Ornithodoros turicata TaxID=34597 RepID=A0A2R5L4N5_9ACAR
MLQEMPAEINMNNQNSQKTETNTSRSARVTATVKVEPVSVGEGLKLNPYYFKTTPGIIKLVQVLFGMICLGCGSPALIGYARFFLFVAAICYIITVLLCVIYILGINTALSSLPWLSGELVYTVLGALLYLIAAITELVMTTSYDWHTMFIGLRDQYIAAGVFGIFQMMAYGAGAFFLFMEWKATRPPPSTQPSAN